MESKKEAYTDGGMRMSPGDLDKLKDMAKGARKKETLKSVGAKGVDDGKENGEVLGELIKEEAGKTTPLLDGFDQAISAGTISGDKGDRIEQFIGEHSHLYEDDTFENGSNASRELLGEYEKFNEELEKMINEAIEPAEGVTETSKESEKSKDVVGLEPENADKDNDAEKKGELEEMRDNAISDLSGIIKGSTEEVAMKRAYKVDKEKKFEGDMEKINSKLSEAIAPELFDMDLFKEGVTLDKIVNLTKKAALGKIYDFAQKGNLSNKTISKLVMKACEEEIGKIEKVIKEESEKQEGDKEAGSTQIDRGDRKPEPAGKEKEMQEKTKEAEKTKKPTVAEFKKKYKHVVGKNMSDSEGNQMRVIDYDGKSGNFRAVFTSKGSEAPQAKWRSISELDNLLAEYGGRKDKEKEKDSKNEKPKEGVKSDKKEGMKSEPPLALKEFMIKHKDNFNTSLFDGNGNWIYVSGYDEKTEEADVFFGNKSKKAGRKTVPISELGDLFERYGKKDEKPAKRQVEGRQEKSDSTGKNIEDNFRKSFLDKDKAGKAALNVLDKLDKKEKKQSQSKVRKGDKESRENQSEQEERLKFELEEYVAAGKKYIELNRKFEKKITEKDLGNFAREGLVKRGMNSKKDIEFIVKKVSELL